MPAPAVRRGPDLSAVPTPARPRAEVLRNPLRSMPFFPVIASPPEERSRLAESFDLARAAVYNHSQPP